MFARRAGLIGSAVVALAALAATAGWAGTPSDGPGPDGSIEMSLSTGGTETIPVPQGAVDAVPSTTGSGDLADVGEPADPADLALVAPDGATDRAIIGTDDRRRVANPTVAPFVQMPQITYVRDGVAKQCTGWLYANKALATAGHCLSNGAGTFSTDVRVYFGANGSDTPSRTCKATTFAVPTKFHEQKDRNSDWGLVRVDCDAGNALGHLGYRVQDPAPSGTWSVTGYPVDKPSATMWTESGAVKVASAYAWSYAIDTTAGQSGAPVWRPEPGTSCGNCVIGLHVRGNVKGNQATRITPALAAAMTTWAAKD